MKSCTILLLVLLSGIILAAGCTLPVSPGSTTPKDDIPVNPAAAAAVTATSSPVPSATTTFWPSAVRVGEITTVPTTRVASDNPYLENLDIRKRTFVNPLPDCLMQKAFPSVARNPEYGIQQVVPKLTAISEDEYEAFLRKYTEGEAGNTQLKTPAICQNTGNEPTWNFIEFRAILVPTNVNPSFYAITENVMSDGKIVAEFNTDKWLVIDEQVILTGYIPIHADEVDLVDNVGMTFTRE
jgi:hypothetical protein